MKRLSRISLLLAALLGFLYVARCQQDTLVVKTREGKEARARIQTPEYPAQGNRVTRMVLTDDSELIGRIVNETPDTVSFQTSAGVRLDLPRKAIRSTETLDGEIQDGVFVRLDPNRTRLFFAPTGRTLPQGKGYFSAYEIFFPFLAVGITDFVTLGGGISLFPGAKEQIVYLAPRIRIVHIEGFDLSGGVLYLSVSKQSGGMLYGVGTIGSPRAGLTVGLGWGFSEGEYSHAPTVVLGGEAQVTNSIKLITENWFNSNIGQGLISFGLRFFGEQIAGDFGLMRSTTWGGEGLPFLPWIGFAYNF